MTGLGMVAPGRHRHAGPRHSDLEDSARQHGVGDRDACGNKHDLQWRDATDPLVRRAQPHNQVGRNPLFVRLK
jgi:hypothetical protein